MKTRIGLYALIALLMAVTPSCVKETSRSDAFTASFELNTPNIYSGEEFQFTITANHDRFKVTEFSFPLDPTFVTVGETYTTDSEGRWRPHAIVPIKETCAGEISITIKDETTGSEKKFSAVYHAFKSSPVTLRIENKPLPKATTNIRDTSTPLLVSGEPLDITLKADGIERLSVKEFKCEFDNGSLPEGKDIIFDKNGEFHISFPTSFSSDKFKEETSLSLTLHNVETDRDTTLTASYLKVLPLRCEVSLSSSVITEGDDVTLSIVSNRKTIQIENISTPSWLSNYQLSNGSSLSLNIASGEEDIYYTGSFLTSSVKVTEDAQGEITLSLKDIEYTGRTILFSIPYSASTQKDPTNIHTSRDNTFFRISEDSVNELSIWTTDEKSNNIFVVSCPSTSMGKVTFYCPKEGETTSSSISASSFREGPITVTNNRVFFKGTGTAGNVTIKVTTKDEKVKKDLTGYVKQSIAVVLAGRFRNDMTEHFGNANGKHYTGWYGFPEYIEAKLYKIDNWGEIKNNTSFSEEKNDIKLSRLTSNNSLSLTTTVRVGKKVSSYYHYYAYRTKSSNWWSGCPSPEAALADMQNRSGYHSQYLSDQPSAVYKEMTEATSNSAGEVDCKKLTAYLQDMDCMARIGWCVFLDHNYGDITEDHLGYQYIDIRVKNVKYNTDIYDLKFYVNKLCDISFLTGSSANTGPWWHRSGFAVLEHGQNNNAISAAEL